jgi:hypothetical protein
MSAASGIKLATDSPRKIGIVLGHVQNVSLSASLSVVPIAPSHFERLRCRALTTAVDEAREVAQVLRDARWRSMAL